MKIIRLISQPQFRIVFIYIVLGLLWIFLSDYITDTLFGAFGYITFVQTVKGVLFIAFTGLLLFFLIKRDIDAVNEVNRRLFESYKETIHGWVHMMDLRHRETKDHSARVTRMSLELCKLMGIEEKRLGQIEQGAILHDIGKIAIPDSILLKPGKLDEKEWDQMRKHPGIGFAVLSDIDFLQPCLDIPFCHHEKWDGTGYPSGLKGEEIPIAARIFAVVDVWDAVSHSRMYKSAWPEGRVLQYLKDQAGIHFDPKIVKTFIDNYEQIKKSAEMTTESQEKSGGNL